MALRSASALVFAFGLAGCSGSVEVSSTSVGASSGASSGGGADTACTVPTELFGSGEALALARCVIPEEAKLVHLVSSTFGELDAQGRDRNWLLIFWDDTAKQRYFGGVSIEGGIMIAPDGESLPCGPDALAHVESETMVPDAVARFSSVDPFAGKGHLNYFLLESRACILDSAEDLHRVLVSNLDPSLPTEEASMQPHNWIVDYDASGSFKQLCGPCTSPYDGCPPCQP
jgi:hypothetical protein